MTDHHIDDHDRGLDNDLPRLISRRRAVGLLAGGLGSALVAACASSPEWSGAGRRRHRRRHAAAGGSIPEEIAGPFPGAGSNGPNVLTESGVVRRDITCAACRRATPGQLATASGSASHAIVLAPNVGV